jgi:hypothetical protein
MKVGDLRNLPGKETRPTEYGGTRIMEAPGGRQREYRGSSHRWSLRPAVLWWISLGLGALLLLAHTNCTEAARRKEDIALWGQANGGTLELLFLRGHYEMSVAVETRPGEDAESVVGKLRDAVNRSEEMMAWGITATAEQNTLVVTYPKCCLALRGTENGLGIPDPPQDLACFLDAESRTIHLTWANPPGQDYDALLAARDGTLEVFEVPGDSVAGTDYVRFDTGSIAARRDYTLIGRKNDTPSDCVRCTVQICQEIEDLLEGDCVDGVAPGWNSWQRNSGTAMVSFECGPEAGDRQSDFDKVGEPGFQIIRGAGDKHNPFEGGVWRKFTGLIPGHRYRIQAYLQMRFGVPEGGDWYFSLHGAHNGVTGDDLSVDQLAGLTALPDGSRGSTAGQISRMDPVLGVHYGVFSSDLETLPGKNIGDISLPEGVTSLTVWVKHGGNIASPGVVLDYVLVRDVTCLE